MKKFLSFILAVLMVLSVASTIVFSAGAEEAAEAQPIEVPLVGPWDQCWAEDLDGFPTQTRIYYNKPGPHGPGGFMFRYGENGKAEAVDISGLKYLEFDVFVSDPAIIADVEFSFELSSSGTSDKQESAKKFKGKDTGWVAGWNHVKWELTEFNSVTDGGLDPTKWNFIRWYNDTSLNATDWLQVAIKDMQFTNGVPAKFTVDVVYDLGGGYTTIEELGDAFLADFNKYGEVSATKENFMPDSSAPIKKALANAEMLKKWNWLWVYMLAHLQEVNADVTNAYVTDAYPVLEKLINGDTSAILESANARTSIRSYIHGFMNGMKGCGDINADFSKYSPNFSSAEEQKKLVKQQFADTNGVGAYETIEQVGDAFLADFNLYGATNASKENFQGDSSAPIKVALAEAEMLEKWNWLWVYMLAHLQELNAGETSAYITDTYAVLTKMIAGDTAAILETANARTSIRSYIHGLLNSMKGCGDINADFSKFSPDFSSEEVRKNFMNYDIAVTLNKGAALMVPTKPGYTFEGWQDETGAIVTKATADGKLTAIWTADDVEPDDGSIRIPLEGAWDQCWPEAIEGVPTQTRVYYNKPGPHGPGGFMFRYGEGGKAEPVDISRMAYLEFDLYISDPAIIADVEFSFELTSAGASDKEESAKKFKGQDTGWVAGWNHVKWELSEFDSKTDGGLDPTKWNFIRWYNDTSLNATDWFQVGMANIKFTPMSPEDMDAEEATKTEHSIPVWGANESWGGGYEVDNENQVAGSGCITINLNGVTGVIAPEVAFDDVDATGMDTIEFDIYLSDLGILDYFESSDSGSIEICSGGACDQGEKAINIFNLVKKLKNQNAVVGWNHVAISIKSMESTPGAFGDFTASCINYIRFYWINNNNCGQNWIVKLDNFRMTDAQKIADEEEAKKEQEILAKYTEVIAKIDALKDITSVTAENYAAAKAQYDEAKAAFDAIPAEDRTVVAENGYSEKLVAANKLITDYEEDVAALEANKDLIEAMKALDAYKEASAFTAENYAEAKAAIEAARAAYDALPRAVRNLLKAEGYLAYLEAAETALPAEAPGGTTTDPGTEPGTGTTEPDKEGCGGVLTVGAVATMVLAGAWVTIAARKKEN